MIFKETDRKLPHSKICKAKLINNMDDIHDYHHNSSSENVTYNYSTDENQ